ncbi:Unknown protein sequence [Pseudomonas syringae pv. maculicola]|nr:Unknown protein sequence [Pseudomonas syringae pv. maculicola]
MHYSPRVGSTGAGQPFDKQTGGQRLLIKGHEGCRIVR